MAFTAGMNSALAAMLKAALDPSDPSHAPAFVPSAAAPAGPLPVAVLGVPFDSLTIPEAIRRIDAMIASQRTHYVVTANVDFLVQAHRDVELRRILLDADLVLCDGTPLVWASRWLGNPLPERVAGSDLAPALLQSAAEKGHRVFLLGAADGFAAAATERLQQQDPLLQVVGHYAPPFSALLEMNHDEILRRVQAARPDILLVSFGCPKQEKWIAMHHRALGVPVTIGVGATLDFLAGRKKRAPRWMRRTGTEWFYRLAQEPRRLYKRYAWDVVYFAPLLAQQWWRLRTRPHAASRAQELPLKNPRWRAVDAGTHLTRAALRGQSDFWRELQTSGQHCLVDCAHLQSIDATGIAFLLRWRTLLQRCNQQLVLLAPSQAIRRILSQLKLTDHFSVADNEATARQKSERLFTRCVLVRRGETRSLAWCGEIVAANADEVWHLSLSHFQTFTDHATTLIIVDLAQLRFIDSSGAALMLRLKRWTQSRHVEVLFSNPQENVRHVLRLTALDHLLLEGGQ